MSSRGVRTGRRERGISLVEAALAMAVMGVAATMLWQTVSVHRHRERQDVVQAQLKQAESAVQAFVAVHRRFPCPASEPAGLEACAAHPGAGFLPVRTLGMPQAMAVHIHYTVDPSIAGRAGTFAVLFNDQTIAPAKGPAAVPRTLRDLLASDYDGMLDVCETLAGIAETGATAFTLQAIPDASTDAARTAQALPGRAVGAAQVAGYMGCGPMVAVAGRGQYNAHLAAAAMAQAVQDHRTQSEVAYSLNHWNLSEGIWSFSNGMYSAMKNWAKLVQTASALDAHIWRNPGPFAALHAKALTDRTVEMVGVAARASNLARYIHNLDIAQNNLSTHHELVAVTLAAYDRATRHALIGSASAWFLREQEHQPASGALRASADEAGVNTLAQAIATASQGAAETLGHGELLHPYTRLPNRSNDRTGTAASGERSGPSALAIAH